MRMRIKDIATKVGSGITPKGGATVYQDSGIPLFRSQNVTNDGFLLDDIVYISEDIHNSMAGSRLKPNDVLLNITGASIGRCYYLPQDFREGNVNQHVCIIRLKKNVIPAFLYFNLISATGQKMIKSCQTGANREGLTKEELCNFAFEIPTIELQSKIVEYLNDKTYKINSNISLLSSNRDAYLRLKKSIINHAVTKGLNPEVKMKASGVDWIGAIPEHWEVKRLKDICDYVSRGSTPDYVENGLYKVMNQATFSKGWIDESNLRYTRTYNKNSQIKKGDLLMASTGGGVLGKILYFDYLDDNFFADSHVTIMRNSKGANSMKYLYYHFFLRFEEINATMVKGSTNQTELQRNYLLSHEVAIPPLSEQQAIAAYLDEKCSKIDKIVANLEKQISLYTDLKRSLIDEVITGKRAV